jgi:hypothetical protein
MLLLLGQGRLLQHFAGQAEGFNSAARSDRAVQSRMLRHAGTLDSVLVVGSIPRKFLFCISCRMDDACVDGNRVGAFSLALQLKRVAIHVTHTPQAQLLSRKRQLVDERF